MDKRIRKFILPGIGDVWLQSLSAAEGCEVEQSRLVDGKPNFGRYAMTLVSKMRLRQQGGPYYRDWSDLEELDYAVFQQLYETCERHRDFISPTDLAKNLLGGESDSPPSPSLIVQGSPASNSSSTDSASGNGASGKPTSSSAGTVSVLPEMAKPDITSIP